MSLKKSYLIILLLLAALTPYFYLCFFAHPSADDFILSYQARTTNFLDLIVNYYFNWGGRYVSSSLIYLTPINSGRFDFYQLVPVLIICFTGFSIFLFLKELFVKIPIHQILICSLLGTLLYFFNMPNIAEGIYWYTGVVVYQTGNIVGLLYLTLFIRIINQKYLITKWIHFCILTIFLFLSIGFNEELLLLIFFFLLITTIIFYKKHFGKRSIVLWQLLFALLFSSFLVFSPGNSVRGAIFSQGHDFVHSFIYAVLQTVRFSAKWIFSVPLIVVSILYYPFNKRLIKQSILFAKSFYLNIWLSTGCLFFILFICVFPPYWVMGILGQHRTVNVAWFFFLLFWFINLTVWFNHFENKLIKYTNYEQKYRLYLMGVLFLGLLSFGNGRESLMDIFSGKAKRFDEQQKERYEILREAKKMDNPIVYLPLIQDKPVCLFVLDISDNPEYWTTKVYNLYFGLEDKKIMVKK